MLQKKFISSGISLIELIIVVLFLGLVALITILVINPKKFINRAKDTNIVTNLDKLKKALEEFYNDGNCYPKPEEICYNEPYCYNGICTCNICGEENSSPDLNPYIKKLPCHPIKDKIMYKTEQTNCPSWFKIFTIFLDKTNPLIKTCGSGGCGSPPSYGYDYGITSPNKNLEKYNDIK